MLFRSASRKLLKRIGVVQPDPIKIAGGAKSLASPDQEFHRDFVLDQIRKSIRLHGTERVILMLHSDCGAYGGAGAFDSPEAERLHHRAELRRATETLRKAIPEITVDPYFVDFEGVWTLAEEVDTVAGGFRVKCSKNS